MTPSLRARSGIHHSSSPTRSSRNSSPTRPRSRTSDPIVPAVNAPRRRGGTKPSALSLRGDLSQVQPLPVELLDPFREASKIFQLLIPADGPSDLVSCRDAAVPDDRHVVDLGRPVGHDDHSLHDAAHDLLAIRRRRPRGVPQRGDAGGERSDPSPFGLAQRRR